MYYIPLADENLKVDAGDEQAQSNVLCYVYHDRTSISN